MLNVIGVIPCRYGSSRLPGKPLLAKTGKPLVQHVYESVRSAESLSRIIIATDDERILDAAESFGADAEMTSPDHLSGTDRMAEIADRIDGDVFVNIQGDEPELDPAHIDIAVNALIDDPEADVSTVCSPLESDAEFDDPNTVKCVVDGKGYALYFSRAGIPYPRSDVIRPTTDELLKHHGVYCFRRDVLLDFPGLIPPAIETSEQLEQLRLLWHGYRIKICMVDSAPKGIDTMEDYEAFVTRVGGDK
jgi:3-deoxy-D-manno-octulosonate cytidylyltransferase